MSERTQDSPLVTAVIVSYRSREATKAAVQSLAASRAAGLLRCVVVDNASNDGTVEDLERTHDWVEVIVNDENVGFGRGCNIGIERARTPYVLLLNPDAKLPAPDLNRLVGFMAEKPRAGIVAPAIREPNGGLQHAGGLPTAMRILRQCLSPKWRASSWRVIHPGEPPFRTDWLCGAVLLLRTSMLADVGLFDPRFFLYFEETDLCRRAASRQWEIWAVGEAVAEHVNAVSAITTGRRQYHGCIAEHYFRSRFRYLVKYYGWPVAAGTELAELAGISLVALCRWILGRDIDDYRTRLRSPFLGRPSRPLQP